MIRTFFRWGLALFFTVGGINHFLHPAIYLGVMPPYLPWPEMLNWISGGAEIAGGLGVLVPGLRRAAGWGLIALLVAVFPANIYMLSHGIPGMHVAQWIFWVRLPFQFVFMAWVYWTCVARSPVTERAK